MEAEIQFAADASDPHEQFHTFEPMLHERLSFIKIEVTRDLF